MSSSYRAIQFEEYAGHTSETTIIIQKNCATTDFNNFYVIIDGKCHLLFSGSDDFVDQLSKLINNQDTRNVMPGEFDSIKNIKDE